MTGSLVLMADLIRLLKMPLRVGVVQCRSYRGAATRPGALTLNADCLPAVSGREVLIVDDIFDTGHTLDELLRFFHGLEPSSLASAVLLRKQGRQEVSVQPDFVGFDIPDHFVVGYGLDYQDEYRHLPYLAQLEPSDLGQA
jgi:hypoxanthine phosphoribosyltransferase